MSTTTRDRAGRTASPRFLMEASPFANWFSSRRSGRRQGARRRHRHRLLGRRACRGWPLPWLRSKATRACRACRGALAEVGADNVTVVPVRSPKATRRTRPMTSSSSGCRGVAAGAFLPASRRRPAGRRRRPRQRRRRALYLKSGSTRDRPPGLQCGSKATTGIRTSPAFEF